MERLNTSVFILIPVHNRREITVACLENLKQTGDLMQYRVVVIDDGSTDGTRTAVAMAFPMVDILIGDGSLWWTGAIHKGMLFALSQGAEFLIWLNDDCRVSQGTISDLIAFSRSHPNSIVGVQGCNPSALGEIDFGGKRKTWKGYRYLRITDKQVYPCDLLSGNLVCLPSTVTQSIGFPDPAEAPHYGGDSLYLLRASKAGFSLFVDSRHLVWNASLNEPQLCPSSWILAPGKPWQLLQLVFNPYSCLSWRLWWKLNWEAYGIWGILMFFKKYLSLIPITFIRCLPLRQRQRLLASLALGKTL